MNALGWNLVTEGKSRLAAVGVVLCFGLAAPVVHADSYVEAVCQDITVYLDESGIYFLSPEEVDGGSVYDEHLEIDTYAVDCYSGFSVPVMLTAYNSDGNSAQCFATVTVIDTMPPNLYACPPAQYALAGPGGLVAVPDVTGEVGADDNCLVSLIEQIPPAGSLVSTGTNIITCFVYDSSGNSAACPIEFVVEGPGPVLSWLLDEGSGTQTLESVSMASNVAALVGPVGWTNGIAPDSSSAVALTESGLVNYIDAGTLTAGGIYETGANTNFMVLSNQWTITAWINLPDPQTVGGDRVIASSDTGQGQNWWLFFVNDTGGGVNDNLGFDFGSVRQMSGISIPLNTNVFVAIQGNQAGIDVGSTNRHRFLVWDGRDWHTREGTEFIPLRMHGLELGAFNTGTREFQGVLDDVRIYGDELSQSVLDLMTLADADGDGTIDYLDDDDDNDGVSDAEEAGDDTNAKNPDTDGDSQTDLEEKIAGTLGNDATSFFGIAQTGVDEVTGVPSFDVEVKPGRVYHFDIDSGAQPPLNWQPALVYTSTFSGPLHITDSAPQDDSRFRVRVELENP